MSPQVKDLIRRGLEGLFLGIAFYLIISSIAKIFLDWFVPFVDRRFPFGETIIIKAIYAVAITLSLGIRVPFGFVSTNLSLLLTSILSGLIGMISFLIMGKRKGVLVFLGLFAMLFLSIAFLGLVMMITG